MLSRQLNLLPWRAKAVRIKIITHLIWHIVIVVICGAFVYLGNHSVDRWLLRNRSQLVTLQSTFEKMHDLALKKSEHNRINDQHLKWKHYIEQNRNRKRLIYKILKDIAFALTPDLSISNFLLEATSLTLNGVTHKESALVAFMKNLKHGISIKKIHLKRMKKNANDGAITFEIQIILKTVL